MTNPNLSKTQFERHDVPASEIREGDRLDIGGRTRVAKVHPRTDKVLVRTQRNGARSPSVSEWENDEVVKVWRKPVTEH